MSPEAWHTVTVLLTRDSFFRLAKLGLSGALLALVSIASAQPTSRKVAATFKPDGEWKDYPTRTLAELPPAAAAKPDADLSRYGGSSKESARATGFFRTEKIDGRWWLIDPDGHRFIHKGVASVRTTSTPGAVAALTAKFGGADKWAQQTAELLSTHGFNGLGGWSDFESFRRMTKPLVYTHMWNFMSAYGKQRGGTFQLPGHTGYPSNCIFVFDPEFEKFCDTYARQLADTKDDPWLLGHFSDNEMPLPREALKNYLSLPEKDAGYQAAIQWLRERHGAKATVQSVTANDTRDFHALVVGRYFQIVSRAIKKYDPNHLYLGSRFYGTDIRYPEIFKACGPHVDVVSVNYYRAWTPAPEKLAMWERESGRPALITEWYAKGVDSGMPNVGGAGWLVKSQRDRGAFYQNFALGLLESKVCVGWHWFKYIDNDPDDKKVDPSNRDSNKGIVNNRYEPYVPLLDAMKQLNDRTYSLVEFFDKPAAPHANLAKPAKKSD